MWGELVAGLVAAAVLLHVLADRRRLRAAPHIEAGRQPRQTPLVSLLIPARDEERVIERAVRAAMTQQYAPLEVLVLDDGSSDATPQILQRLQTEYPQLTVLQGVPMPAGWYGKPHACQQLSSAAHGEWLLFLDADTAAAPQLTAALLAHAEAHGADMATIFPFQELGSAAERIILPPFFSLVSALHPLQRLTAPDARPDEVLANGQCILVRRTAYEAIGGHRAVATEVLEDVRLAQALRRSGAVLSGGIGLDLLRVRMYTRLSEVVSGLMKHAAAGMQAIGNRRGLAVTLRLLFQAWAPLWLLGFGLQRLALTGQPVLLLIGLVAAAAVLLLWSGIYRKLYHQPGWYALCWPFGLLAYFLIAAAGIFNVAIGRGVSWRGRVYPR